MKINKKIFWTSHLFFIKNFSQNKNIFSKKNIFFRSNFTKKKFGGNLFLSQYIFLAKIIFFESQFPKNSKLNIVFGQKTFPGKLFFFQYFPKFKNSDTKAGLKLVEKQKFLFITRSA